MRLTKRGKKRLILVSILGGLFLIAATGVVLYRTVYRDHLARVAKEEGLALYEEGKYEAALPKLSFYISRLGQDNDPETLAIFADTRRKVPQANGRNLLSAIGLYQHARSLDPDNLSVLEGLLELYRETGRRVELSDTADLILAINPDHVRALEAKSAALRDLGRFAEAKEAAEKLVVLEPAEFSYRALVLDLANRNGASEEDLIAICDEWIAREPVEDGRLLLIKAITLATIDEVAASQALMREAAQRGAGEGVLPVMVDWLERLELLDDVGALIARSREAYEGQGWFHQFIIEREWRGGRTRAARTELEQATEALGDSDPQILRLAALLHTFAGNKDEARSAIENLERVAAAAAPEDRDLYRGWAGALRARLELAESDWRAAIEAYRQAQSIAPDDEVIHYLLGEALVEVGELEQAALHFRRAFPEESTWVAAGSAYVQTLLQLGRHEDAYIVGLDLVTRTRPQILEPWLLWFEAWLALDESGLRAPEDRAVNAEPHRLVRVLEGFYTQSEHEEAVGLLLVRAYLAHGLNENATEIAREALASEATSGALLLQLARAFSSVDASLARNLLDSTEQRGGVTPESAMVRATMLAADGRAEQGLDRLDEALEASELPEIERLRMRLQYLARAGLPEVRDAVRAIAAHESASAADLVGILSIDETWKDQPLIDRTIERLKEQIGEDSVRVQLAEAGRTLHFTPDDPEAVSKSIIALDSVLRRLPDSLPARTLMAGLLLQGDRPDEREAVRHLRAAVDRYPSQVTLYPQLISLLQKMGEYPAAEQYLNLLSGQQSDLSATMQRTELELLHLQGEFNAAINKLSGMMTEDSPETDRILLASLNLKAGQIEEARREVEDLLRRFGGSWMTLRFASHFYASQGQLQRAIDLLREANIEGGESTRALLIGSFYHEQGYPTEAGDWLRKAVELDPKNLNGWSLLSQHYLALGDYDQAREAALKGLEKDPEHEPLRVALASIGLADPNPESRRKAIAVFRKLRGDNEALIDTMVMLDRAMGDEGELESDPALLDPVRALTQKHSRFLPAWRLAVLLHAQAGRRVEAINLAREAMIRMPAQAEPVVWAAELLTDSGQYREALGVAQEWRLRSLEDPLEADLMIARLHLSLRSPQLAYQTLAPHAVRIEQEKDWSATRDEDEQAVALARFELWLRTLLLNGEFQRSLTLVELDSDPQRWVGPWLSTTRLLEHAAARQSLRTVEPLALRSSTTTLDLATSWIMLGRETQESSDFDQADRLAVSVVDDESVRTYAMLCRAELSDARGELEEAVALYQTVLGEEPAHKVALNNLAYLLGPKLNRYDEALTYSTKVVSAYPDIPDFLDTHALILLGLGRVADAEEAARSAQQMRPEDPGFLLTLTGVLVKSGGNMVEARQMLDRARDLMNAAPVRNRHLEERLAALEEEMESRTG